MRPALLVMMLLARHATAAESTPAETPQPPAPAPTETPQPATAPAASSATPPPPVREPVPAVPSSLDFDLLGTPPPPTVNVDADAMRRRRTLLSLHQGFGIALATLMAGSIVTGQLNYSDRFSGSSTGRWERPHTLLTFSTLLTFAGTGALAALAPVPLDQESRGFDRVRLHEAGMIGATLGMISEGTLGILTAHNEGRLGQARLADAHMAIGYTTLAFMLTALGALVF